MRNSQFNCWTSCKLDLEALLIKAVYCYLEMDLLLRRASKTYIDFFKSGRVKFCGAKEIIRYSKRIWPDASAFKTVNPKWTQKNPKKQTIYFSEFGWWKSYTKQISWNCKPVGVAANTLSV